MAPMDHQTSPAEPVRGRVLTLAHYRWKELVSKSRRIEAAAQGKVQVIMVLKVMVGELGAFVHDEIRWSDCVVVVNHKFIVAQHSSVDYLCKNLTLDQYPLQKKEKKKTRQPGTLTESYPGGG